MALGLVTIIMVASANQITGSSDLIFMFYFFPTGKHIKFMVCIVYYRSLLKALAMSVIPYNFS
jgi:hypothetical protein